MHQCPECSQVCTCNGDWDDILWPPDSAESELCTHSTTYLCERFDVSLVDELVEDEILAEDPE